ncbi:MAG: penicillin-binding protein 2 [Microcoleaceae cyanobacterium]
MTGESPFDIRYLYHHATNETPSTCYRRRWHKGILLLLLVSSFFSLCTLQLSKLQFVQGEYNQRWAEANRLRLVPIPASRGQIVDRKGKVIATSRLSRSVYALPFKHSPEQWQAIIPQLSEILKIPTEDILEKLETASYRSRVPVLLQSNLTPGMFIPLAEQFGQMPGLEVRGESARDYPNRSLAAHILGYVGEATLTDLEANPEYPMGMIVGKVGIERQANPDLDGVWGNRLIEVDARGTETQELGIQSPVSGEPVELTLDLELQKTAETTLGNRRGAAVMLDVKTGAILALASAPSYDPNLFTRQVSAKDWEHLQRADNPLLNRALQGYPPGSTFKIVTSTAGIGSGKMSPNSTIATSGSITLGGTTFHEYSGSGFGVIGFKDALAYSSNTFFYQVGMKAGAEELSKWGRELGIGGSINLDLLGLDGANHGQIPTPEEKERKYDTPWYLGDTVSMSIGQGLVLATPLELAVMVSTVANGGTRVQPHLLASQTNTPATQPVKTEIAPETLKVIREGLIEVVKKGTGRALNDGTIPLTGGKTGTVEVPGKPDNSMYVAFGPADQPEVAIAVVVEEGGYGSTAAAPIAHELFRVYFKSKPNATPNTN